MICGRDIWAVVPVKLLTQAKQRLAPSLPTPMRQALVLAMLMDVLEALGEVEGLGVAVATSDPRLAGIAAAAGAAVFADNADDGYTAAAASAGQRLAREGRAGMMILPGDVPGITAAEIRQVLAAHRPGHACTIVPSRDRTGTNAIFMTPPGAVPLAFGPNSFHRHCEGARRAGIEPVVLRFAGIGLDLDEMEDVATFLRSTAPTHTRAALTRGVAVP